MTRPLNKLAPQGGTVYGIGIGSVAAIVCALLFVFLLGIVRGEQRAALQAVEREKLLRGSIEEYCTKLAERDPEDEQRARRAERRQAHLKAIERLKRTAEAENGAGYYLSYLYDQAHPAFDEEYLLWAYRHSSAAVELTRQKEEHREYRESLPAMDESEKKTLVEADWKERYRTWVQTYPEAERAYRQAYAKAYGDVNRFKIVDEQVRSEREAKIKVDAIVTRAQLEVA